MHMRGRNIFCIYRLVKLVNGLKNVEKYGFYLFQSMLEKNEICYIIPIYKIYCLHKYPPLPGPGVKLSPIQTFLSDLLDHSRPRGKP